MARSHSLGIIKMLYGGPEWGTAGRELLRRTVDDLGLDALTDEALAHLARLHVEHEERQGGIVGRQMLNSITGESR